MARPRSFDETQVVAIAAALFARLGFNATSIDDLLQATGLQRGSLYKAFGSKRNLFEKALISALNPEWINRPEALDLLTVALKELAPVDPTIANLCRTFLTDSRKDCARILGTRLLQHLDA